MEESKKQTFVPVQEVFVPNIMVIGTGGAGGNVVTRMVSEGVQNVRMVVCNTDQKALQRNKADVKIDLGRELTKGRGAGARPEVGANAAEDSIREVENQIKGSQMIFIAAGMGGGTGTGAAPVVARAAKAMKVLTVAIVTLPFSFEGKRRMKTALEGVEKLREHTDTLLVIPNDKLYDATTINTSLIEAFHLVDTVLINAIQGITDLVNGVGDINVDFADDVFKENFSKRYYEEKKLLKISNTLSRESKEFMIAQQIGLLVAKDAINKQLELNGVISNNSIALGRTVLANYFASALIMPYDFFWETAEKCRYDIDVLCNSFDTSFEQVCHRLTTLQKDKKMGIPFHFMRVDVAGNVSKRFSISGLKIPRYSVACPRWNVYTAFLNPGKIKVQLSKMLDGKTFVCFAKTVSKRIGDYRSPETFFSIGMGFDLKYAQRCIYSDSLDLSKPVATGLSCRTCERENCRQRAFPPIHRNMKFDENIRGLSGYINPKDKN